TRSNRLPLWRRARFGYRNSLEVPVDDQSGTDRYDRPVHRSAQKTGRRHFRPRLRTNCALDSQGQALLGARLRHFFRAPAPRPRRLQSAHQRAHDHSGGPHRRLSSRAAAEEGSLTTAASKADERDPPRDLPHDQTTPGVIVSHRALSLILLVVALVAGGVLRFYDLGALEMSPDEGASWAAASAPTAAEVIARQPALNPGALPIHDLMLHEWIALFGTSMTAMRAMSAAFGLVSILLVYLVCCELFELDSGKESA